MADRLTLICAAFLIGSLPFGVWIARLFRVRDLRYQGSGNIGATNVTRVVGWRAGAITLLLDCSKGAFAAWLGGSELAAELFGFSMLGPTFGWTLAFAAVLGHCYSPWLRFQGGKGVSTGFGALLVLSPIAAAVGVLGYLLAFWEKRIGSTASLAGLGLASVAEVVLNPVRINHLLGAAMILLILVRHDRNLDALLENSEKHF